MTISLLGLNVDLREFCNSERKLFSLIHSVYQKKKERDELLSVKK